MARNLTTFRPDDGREKGRIPRDKLYERPIRAAEQRIADHLPLIVDEMLKLATGHATQFLLNHKTGEVQEVPAAPADVQKAGEYLINRIMGKPEVTKVHELGTGAKDVFKVLVGGAAEAHWAQLAEPIEVQVIEAGADDDTEDGS